MITLLLFWILVAPTASGASSLRPKVTRVLARPLCLATGLWLAGAATGVGLALAGLLLHLWALVALGPFFALMGAGAAVGITLGQGLREDMWVRTLGLPPGWSRAWRRGELFRPAPPMQSEAWEPTPIERWRVPEAGPTERISRCTLEEAEGSWVDEAAMPKQPVIRQVRTLDAARMRTPPMGGG